MAPRRLPSFFKILLHPSTPHLPFPHAFVRRHLDNKIPEDPILLSVNGGYSWSLKIRRTGETYCFADGWINVVEEGHLGFGDFLLFWLVDQSTFKLSVFSPNGCEKHFPPKIQVKYNDDDEQDEKEDEEDEDDGDGDYFGGGDEEDQDDDGSGGDPFFTKIISKKKYYMRLPLKFVLSTGIDVEPIIAMRNLDGKEWQMRLRSEKCSLYSRYILSAGWTNFRRVNELSEGDECVFKFIRSENKLCLAKVTKKALRPKDDDGDPFFMKIMSKDHKFTMRLPSKFVRSAGLNVERMIAMKNLDGMEWQVRLRLEKCALYSRYRLSAGWMDFWRVNELSEGDKCVFKFIRSEDKLCLAKVTKKALRPKQPASKVPVVRCKKLFSSKIHIKHEEEDEDGGGDQEEDDDENGDGDQDDDDGDPFFMKIMSKDHKFTMRLPSKFVRSAGLNVERMIAMKNLDGMEWQVRLRLEKCALYSRYRLSAGWTDFWRVNELSEGDKCVFKFIRSEDKLCLAKVTKKTVRPKQSSGD